MEMIVVSPLTIVATLKALVDRRPRTLCIALACVLLLDNLIGEPSPADLHISSITVL
jgi:hypothetical protein